MYHEGSHNFLWHFLNLMFFSSQIIVYLQMYVISQEGCIFYHEVFFRMYLALALEVYNRLFIGSVCFMMLDKNKVTQQAA